MFVAQLDLFWLFINELSIWICRTVFWNQFKCIDQPLSLWFVPSYWTLKYWASKRPMAWWTRRKTQKMSERIIISQKYKWVTIGEAQTMNFNRTSWFVFIRFINEDFFCFRQFCSTFVFVKIVTYFGLRLPSCPGILSEVVVWEETNRLPILDKSSANLPITSIISGKLISVMNTWWQHKPDSHSSLQAWQRLNVSHTGRYTKLYHQCLGVIEIFKIDKLVVDDVQINCRILVGEFLV